MSTGHEKYAHRAIYRYNDHESMLTELFTHLLVM